MHKTLDKIDYIYYDYVDRLSLFLWTVYVPITRRFTMTTLLRTILLGLVLFVGAFGCQEGAQDSPDTVNPLTFSQVEGVTMVWEIEVDRGDVDISTLSNGGDWFYKDLTIYAEVYEDQLYLGVKTEACHMWASYNCDDTEELYLGTVSKFVDMEDYESDDVLEVVMANLQWDLVSWQSADHDVWVTEFWESYDNDTGSELISAQLYPEDDEAHDVRLEQSEFTIDQLFGDADEINLEDDLDELVRDLI